VTVAPVTTNHVRTPVPGMFWTKRALTTLYATMPKLRNLWLKALLLITARTILLYVYVKVKRYRWMVLPGPKIAQLRWCLINSPPH